MPWRTVFKNVIFGLECQGMDNGEGQSRARKFIKLVGLEGFEDHYPHELSGGMQQRCNSGPGTDCGSADSDYG